MRYVSGDWDSRNKSPLIAFDVNRNIIPLEQRNLPFDGTLYPFLTVDDVFQPYLMETVFPISDTSFFTASSPLARAVCPLWIKPNRAPAREQRPGWWK